MNPSSWFADQFVDFYNETYDKNYHFQLTTAGVRSVMERVRDYMDDIGFVYILSHQKENFLYELAKNKLQFVALYETDVVFYPGRLTELYNTDKEAGIYWKIWREAVLYRIIRMNFLILVLYRKILFSGRTWIFLCLPTVTILWKKC